MLLAQLKQTNTDVLLFCLFFIVDKNSSPAHVSTNCVPSHPRLPSDRPPGHISRTTMYIFKKKKRRSRASQAVLCMRIKKRDAAWWSLATHVYSEFGFKKKKKQTNCKVYYVYRLIETTKNWMYFTRIVTAQMQFSFLETGVTSRPDWFRTSSTDFTLKLVPSLSCWIPALFFFFYCVDGTRCTMLQNRTNAKCSYRLNHLRILQAGTSC